DPEGCAACSAKSHPENAYRNTSLYAAYTAEALKDSIALAQRSGANLEGLVTWSFEFEEQPYFEGFRELATNGIDKPVLNTFRMLGMMNGEQVKLTSTAAAWPELVLRAESSVVESVDGIATLGERELCVMLWNFREEDISGPARKIRLEVAGLPKTNAPLAVEQFRVDSETSNSYAAWRKMGSPQNPTAEQYEELEASGRLQRVGMPQATRTAAGEH